MSSIITMKEVTDTNKEVILITNNRLVIIRESTRRTLTKQIISKKETNSKLVSIKESNIWTLTRVNFGMTGWEIISKTDKCDFPKIIFTGRDLLTAATYSNQQGHILKAITINSFMKKESHNHEFKTHRVPQSIILHKAKLQI